MGVKLIIEELAVDKICVGVIKEECDPYIEIIHDCLATALQQALEIKQRAEEKWATDPRNPAYKAPAPEKPVTESKQKSTGSKQKSTESKQKSTGSKQKSTESKKKSTESKKKEQSTPQLPLLKEKGSGEKKCRVCGCTQNDPCEEGCSWVEPDLCSACRDKEIAKQAEAKPGLYLQNGSGPFNSVQEALDAYGAPKDTRPQHNRYDRLSKAWQQIIIRRV